MRYGSRPVEGLEPLLAFLRPEPLLVLGVLLGQNLSDNQGDGSSLGFRAPAQPLSHFLIHDGHDAGVLRRHLYGPPRLKCSTDDAPSKTQTATVTPIGDGRPPRSIWHLVARRVRGVCAATP